MSSKAWVRKSVVAVLLLWPLLHMGLSLSGKFSSWRFGGWGMYATPYPSLGQHPISVLVEHRAPGCEASRPQRATVLLGADDIQLWLEERVGIRFYVRCGSPAVPPIQLGDTAMLVRLTSETTAARQLDRAQHLEALARLVEELLVAAAAEPHQLYVSMGTLRAAPATGKYGVEDHVFAYAGHLQPKEIAFTEARRE